VRKSWPKDEGSARSREGVKTKKGRTVFAMKGPQVGWRRNGQNHWGRGKARLAEWRGWGPLSARSKKPSEVQSEGYGKRVWAAIVPGQQQYGIVGKTNVRTGAGGVGLERNRE